MAAVLVVIGAIALCYFLVTGQNAIASDSQTAAAVSNGGNCQVLSYAVIRGLAFNAGFGGDSDTAAAIAMAESSGRPFVLGDLNLAPYNGPAVGLWQINSAKHTDYTVEELQNPQTNANEAFAIYSAAGDDFTDWTTYNNGAYQRYLENA